MGNTTTVQRVESEREDGTKQVQYRLVVPKGIAEARDLAGSKVEWMSKSAKSLELREVDDAN